MSGATLKVKTTTAPNYPIYALEGGLPLRPELILQSGNGEKGEAIEVEVWSVPTANFGSFVAGIPAPLGIGKIKLADGSQVAAKWQGLSVSHMASKAHKTSPT